LKLPKAKVLIFGCGCLERYRMMPTWIFTLTRFLNLPLVDGSCKSSSLRLLLMVNSSGGIIIPRLLELMGVEVVELYCEPNGHFHNQSLERAFNRYRNWL
jgi:hypothetical protein